MQYVHIFVIIYINNCLYVGGVINIPQQSDIKGT